jgi:type II secretion system protein N
MNRFSKIFLYSLYAILSLLIFLYFRFPSALMKEILLAQIQKAQPLARLDTERVSPTIPPGIKLEPLSVAYANTPIVRMDDLRITPRLFSILGQTKRFDFKGSLGTGVLTGQVDTGLESNGEQAQISANLFGVPLEFLEILYQYQGFRPEGQMDAKIHFDSNRGGGTSDVSLEISHAHITLDPPLMGLETIDFSLIKAQLTASPRMVQIRNCEASGDQLESKLTGSIVFRQPLEESRITLSLTVKPQPAFIADHKNDMIGGLLASDNAQKRGLIFRISGTLNNPNYVIR